MLTKNNIFPEKKDVVDAVLRGILCSKENYTSWTCDELYLSTAPNNFLRVHIAQEIAKLEDKPEIFMDATLADILRCSLSSRTSYKAFMKDNNLAQGTFCLTLDERFTHLSDNDSVSRVIMSIQNGVRNAQDEYKNQIKRICIMLEREKKEDSSLDYGIFAFYLDISNLARKKTQKRLDEIISSFDAIVSSHNGLTSTFKRGDINIIEGTGEWCIACYLIEPTF
ncbi:MAG: hypothetical protein HRT41_06975 [Campylobacteraceae bacterium]|nr:hypothetical protein [Campylobacteraceae bacterium]